MRKIAKRAVTFAKKSYSKQTGLLLQVVDHNDAFDNILKAEFINNKTLAYVINKPDYGVHHPKDSIIHRVYGEDNQVMTIVQYNDGTLKNWEGKDLDKKTLADYQKLTGKPFKLIPLS